MEKNPHATRDSALFWLILAVLACFGLRTISNSDFWIHLATGRLLAESGWIHADPFSFTTAQDRTWVNPNWLYDALLYRIWSVGEAPAAILAFVACVAASFWAIRPLCAAAAGAGSQATALLAIAWLIAPALVPGPHGPALLLAALYMRALATWSSRKAFLVLVPLQVLWTNLHGSFLLGPALAALFVWESMRLGERRLARGLPAALLAATVLTPYGFGLHRLALQGIFNPASNVLLEWISPFHGEFEPFWGRHAVTLMLAIIASGFITISGRLPIALTTLGALGAFLLIVSPRYYVFSGLLMFPFAARSVEGAAAWLRARQPNLRFAWAKGALATLGVISLLAVGTNYYFNRIGSASTFGLGVALENFPDHACKNILNRPDFPARAINLAHDGGYLAWKLPQRKIFTDSRTPVYGLPFYQGLGKALVGETNIWNQLVARFAPEAVILSGTWSGSGHTARRLIDTGQWALAYVDGTTIVLVRRTQEHAHLIYDFEVQRAGLQRLENERRRYVDEVARWRPARNHAGLIGAANLFFALWRFDDARVVLSLLTRGSPTYGLAWQNLGICLYQRGQLKEAAAALEQTVRLRPASPLAWLWLGKVYDELGETRKAARARQKGRKLNPDVARTFERGPGSATNTLLPAQGRALPSY